MGIWNLIRKNFLGSARTRQPQDLVPLPGDYRADLRHETSLCTTCQTCASVCSPGAITFDRSLPGRVSCQYQMLGCTFCGRCVDNCPTGALSFGKDPQLLAHAVEQTRHEIITSACPRCGAEMIALPEVVLEKQYGSPLPADIAELNRLCPRCRKKSTSEAIKRGFTGT